MGCVIVCNPREQVVLTISVVRLYAPARLGQLSLEPLLLLLLLSPHATKHREQTTAAKHLGNIMVSPLMLPEPPEGGKQTKVE
jgi:hypothetical protein